MKTIIGKLLVGGAILILLGVVIVGLNGALESISHLPSWLLYAAIIIPFVLFFINYETKNKKP